MRPPGAETPHPARTGILPKPSYLTLSKRAFVARCAAGMLLVNLFVFGMTAMSLHQSRRQYRAQAVVTTDNLAHLLEAYICGIAEKADLSLLTLTSHVERRWLSSDGIRAYEMGNVLARHLVRLPELDSLRVVNVRGEVISATDAAGIRIGAAERDVFRRLRLDPQAGLVVSRPVFEPGSGKGVLMLARRINNPDGSFAGAALGAIRLQQFLKLFGAINVGTHGSISLRDDALGRVLRYPQYKEAPALPPREAARHGLQDLVREGYRSGSYREISNLDLRERTYSFRKIANQPLFVVIGLAESDYLAGWRKEAAKRWTLVALFAFFTAACSFFVYRDWTRRKEAVQELARQESMFRTVADYPFDWEFWLNPKGAYIHSSPSCERVTGYAPAAFYDNPYLLDDIMLPEDLELFVAHRHEALQHSVPGELAFRIRHADGGVRWIGHVCQPIIDPSGAFLGTRGSNRDITARKEAEAEILTLNDELELRVSQAVQELRAKDRLMIIQSRQAAMGEMIHNIAHQWRQPLNNLGLLIQSIIFDHGCGDLTPARMERYREQGVELILFMSQTIDGFRNFFCADKQAKRFSIVQSAHKAHALLAATLKQDRIKVSIEHGEEIYIDGYPNEYAQALVNLFGNAREVLLEREVPRPEIRVKAVREGELAVLTVRDNAGGISEEIIGRVFDPYFTTKHQVGGAGAGSGIGLYISKTIVERHMAGSLSVANVDGGAEFRIEVPLAKETAQDRAGECSEPDAT